MAISNRTDELPSLTFEAFKSGRLEVIEPLTMDSQKFLILGKELYPDKVQSDLAIMAKQASERAAQTTNESFKSICSALASQEFHWELAELASIRAKIRTKGGTLWTEYSETSGPPRMDAHLEITDEEQIIRIKIDDCYLVDNRRFIGGGFRLYSS